MDQHVRSAESTSIYSRCCEKAMYILEMNTTGADFFVARRFVNK